MFAGNHTLVWKSLGNDRHEASFDGRYARVFKAADGWHWSLTYSGETETIAGVARSLRAAQNAVTRF